MRQIFCILAFTFLQSACNQNDLTTKNKHNEDKLEKSASFESFKKVELEIVKKRVSFRSINKIVTDSSYSTWVKSNSDNASLALHFQNKDTLAFSYSPECWLFYPYKVESNKIVVFWDKNIDTKYNFDIVKAVNRVDKKLIGKPFMILELENDTTLYATYLMKELIKRVNSSSKDRTLFTDKYIIVQNLSH